MKLFSIEIIYRGAVWWYRPFFPLYLYFLLFFENLVVPSTHPFSVPSRGTFSVPSNGLPLYNLEILISYFFTSSAHRSAVATCIVEEVDWLPCVIGMPNSWLKISNFPNKPGWTKSTSDHNSTREFIIGEPVSKILRSVFIRLMARVVWDPGLRRRWPSSQNTAFQSWSRILSALKFILWLKLVKWAWKYLLDFSRAHN